MLRYLTRTVGKQLLNNEYSTAAVTKIKPAKSKGKVHVSEQPALISCKRSEFDLFQLEDKECKFGTIPLASKGWLHHKSKGDYFIIKPTVSEEELQSQYTDVKEFLKNSDLTVDSRILNNLKAKLDIERLTPIQTEGIPIIYNYHHALVAAETGCGKTLVYLLPIVQRILELKANVRSNVNERKLNSPLAVILTPSRELTTQIGEVAEALTDGTDLKVKTILGGNTKRLLLDPEFGDVDILVASMGALSKLVTTGIYRMNHVRYVVLDEADTLLDDTFSGKLCHFLKRFQFHKNHVQDENTVGTQLLLASATMPTNIGELLQEIIDVQTIKEVVSPNLHKLMPHVAQKFIRVTKDERPFHLLSIVKQQLAKQRPVIIFSNKSVASDYVSIFLNNSGVNCLNLNGDMLMKIRLGRFEKFQNSECDVLSTTDVGSRGLDTQRARHVINFDFPLHVSDYIHRCGRIGRVGNMRKCFVTNIVSSRREIDVVQRIEHAARTGGLLPNVNANIKNLINQRIMNEMKKAGIPVKEDLQSVTMTDEDVEQLQAFKEEMF